MAKILVITETLSPTVVRLVTALKHQQHQVTVLTSQDEDAHLPDGIDLLRPFRRWSLSEGLRLVPVVYALNPQIVHLVLDEDRLNAAQTMMALVAKAIPRAVLTTSLLHIRQGLRRRNPVRYLLQESDVVTCPSVETLGAMRGLQVRSMRQGRGILPPVLDWESEEILTDRSSASLDLIKGIAENPYVVMPFMESGFDAKKSFFKRLATIAAHRHTVLLGSFSAWPLRERKLFQTWMQKKGLGGRWTLTGHLTRSDLRRLLSQADAFMLAGQGLSPLETTEYFLHGIQAGTTLILDHRQATIHADLWRHSENCWILPADQLLPALIELMSKKNLRLPQTLPQDLNLHRDLVDAPLNDLNRLYNRALSQKHL